jgi:hypothetical protein
MCIDCQKLIKAMKKDHFPLPFIDEMLERLAKHSPLPFIDEMLEQLAKHSFFCFLDGYSSCHQIPIHPDDQSKTIFTCLYGTYAYHRMSFGLCNAPASFQRCMMSIFSNMIEEIIEVFMDDFSIYGKTFNDWLENLDRVLQRCEENHLVLN